MNLLQQNKLSMYFVTAMHIENTDAAVLNQMPKFVNHSDAFKLLATQIMEVSMLQAKRLNGYKIHKDSLRDELTFRAMDVTKRIVGYAVNIEDEVLEKEMAYSQSSFNDMPDRKVVYHAELIIKAATVLGETLLPYGITPEMITALSVSATAFEAYIPKTRMMIAERRQYTATITALFREADKLLAKMDKLAGILEHTEPAFVGLYRSSRHTIRPGYRKLSLKGNVTDNGGNPLKNVRIHIEGLDPIFTTAKGNFWVKKIPVGDHTSQVTLSGYEESRHAFSILRGSTVKLKIVLRLKAV